MRQQDYSRDITVEMFLKRIDRLLKFVETHGPDEYEDDEGMWHGQMGHPLLPRQMKSLEKLDREVAEAVELLQVALPSWSPPKVSRGQWLFGFTQIRITSENRLLPFEGWESRLMILKAKARQKVSPKSAA
jgi:hypothetical protein